MPAPRSAPLLLGAAYGLLDERRIRLDPTLIPPIAEARATLDAEFGAGEVERLGAEGRTLQMAEAAAMARGEAAAGREP